MPMAPSRTRWTILALLFAISIVTYIDRVNIAVAARHMMPALGLTDVQMGTVFSAFVVGYALFQVPGGWLGDRWGARLILTLAVLWWSACTALTSLAPTLPTADWLGVLGSLVLVRFLIGVGEAAALPNFNRTVANWLAPNERGLGIGVAVGGIGLGSAVTPPLTAWIMVNFGWQTAFYAAGALGTVIAALWWLYATDHPRRHPRVNEAELAIIGGGSVQAEGEVPPVPWRSIARTPTLWWLVLSYTCLGYVAYVYLTWFYLYLVNVRGFDLLRGAWYSAAPFAAILVFCPFGGWATDRLAAARGINQGRAWAGGTGMVLATASILGGAFSEQAYAAIALLALGAGWLYFSVGAYWASTSDLSRAHAGSISGLMNTGANLGGAASPVLTPWFAERFGWSAALSVAAGVAFVGALLWIRIRPGDGLKNVPGDG
jgi:ACS family glucarate transporter-like MFS transporter